MFYQTSNGNRVKWDGARIISQNKTHVTLEGTVRERDENGKMVLVTVRRKVPKIRLLWEGTCFSGDKINI